MDLTIGPALEEGFYYDCFMGERNLGEADKARIEKRIEAVGAEAAGSWVGGVGLAAGSTSLGSVGERAAGGDCWTATCGRGWAL